MTLRQRERLSTGRAPISWGCPAVHHAPAEVAIGWGLPDTEVIIRLHDVLGYHGSGDAARWNPEPARPPQSEEDSHNLKQQMGELQGKLSECLNLLNALTDHASNAVVLRSAAINSIIVDDADVILNRPMFFLIEEYEGDDEVVARIPELQADGFGKTEIQAINELKTFVGELYQDLMQTPDKKLGKLPLQWKRILQEVVGIDAREKLQR